MTTNKTIIISSFAGFGDQLMGYISGDVIAFNLDISVKLNMDIFNSDDCPVIVKKEFSVDRIPNNSLKLNISCRSGRKIYIEKMKKKDFWKKFNEYNNINFNSNVCILESLVCNKNSPVNFVDNNNVINEAGKSLQRFFNLYTKIDECVYNKIKEYKKHKLVVIHIRTGDDIFMLKKLRLKDWSKKYTQKIHNIFNNISNNLTSLKNFKICLLSDLNLEDLHKIAYQYINKNMFHDYSNILPTHSTRQTPSNKEWCKIIEDFLVISNADWCYITPNSNFSRLACVYGRFISKQNNYYYIDGEGIITKTDDNILRKGENLL